jgi:hypothetical protein
MVPRVFLRGGVDNPEIRAADPLGGGVARAVGIRLIPGVEPGARTAAEEVVRHEEDELIGRGVRSVTARVRAIVRGVRCTRVNGRVVVIAVIPTVRLRIVPVAVRVVVGATITVGINAIVEALRSSQVGGRVGAWDTWPSALMLPIPLVCSEELVGLLKAIYVSVWGAMLFSTGCQPRIFIYEFQLMSTLPVDALTFGPGSTSLQTDYELTFVGNVGGQNTMISCAGGDGFAPDDITKVTPGAWVIAGPYYDNPTAFSDSLSGTALSRDWPMQIEVGGGQACGRGEVIGALTVPQGTLNLPKPSDYLHEGYYPDKADVLGGWDPFEAQATFEDEVVSGFANHYGSSLGIEIQTRVCVNPLRITGDPTQAISTDLHFLHLVQFEIEGKGHPCSESESSE